MALGLGDYAGRPIMETLIDFLEHRELLLILDSCQHLADSCGSFIEELVDVCSGTRNSGRQRPRLRCTRGSGSPAYQDASCSLEACRAGRAWRWSAFER